MKLSFKQQPRARRQTTTARTPLTFYRSPKQSTTDSPFKPKTKTPRTNRLATRIVDYSLVLLLVVGFAYSLMVKPQPKLSLDSTLYHPAATYETAAKKELKGLKNRNKLTFDEKSVTSSLKKQFPEIENASISLALVSQVPKLSISVAAPAFILNSQGVDYVVNSQGVAVGKRPNLPRINGLPTVIDQTGYSVKTGEQVVSSGAVDFIDNLLAQTKRSKVPVASLTLPARAQELDLRTSDRSYYTKFFLGGDVLAQTGQFLASRAHFDQTGIQPSDYLDVRVGGKIYYK